MQYQLQRAAHATIISHLTIRIYRISYSAKHSVAATQALLQGSATLYPYASNVTMYVVVRHATYAAHLLFSLFVANSALPTTSQVPGQSTDIPINPTLRLDLETLIRLPNDIPWSPEVPTSQASISYPVPNTIITLDFTYLGFPIPIVRALSIIHDGRQQVLSHLASSSVYAKKGRNFRIQHAQPLLRPACVLLSCSLTRS